MSVGDAREEEEVRDGGRKIIRHRGPRGAPARVVRGDVVMAAVATYRLAIHTIARRRRGMMEVLGGREKKIRRFFIHRPRHIIQTQNLRCCCCWSCC